MAAGSRRKSCNASVVDSTGVGGPGHVRPGRLTISMPACRARGRELLLEPGQIVRLDDLVHVRRANRAGLLAGLEQRPGSSGRAGFRMSTVVTAGGRWGCRAKRSVRGSHTPGAWQPWHKDFGWRMRRLRPTVRLREDGRTGICGVRRAPAGDGCGRTPKPRGWRGRAGQPAVRRGPGHVLHELRIGPRMLEWFVRCVDCGASVESEARSSRAGASFRRAGPAPAALRPRSAARR